MPSPLALRADAALGDDQKLDLLRGLSFFSDFDDDELDEVLDEVQWETFRAKAPVINDGDTDARLFVIVKGRASVEKGGVSVIELAPGSCFGEIGFMEGLAQVGSVVPSERTTVVSISVPVKSWGSVPVQLRFNARLQRTVVERLAAMTMRVVEVHR